MRRKKREILLQVIFSMFLSIFFWLSIELSNDFTYLLTIPIKYINYPSKEILVTTLPKNLEFTISGKGFDLLKTIFMSKRDTIQIDLTDALKNGFIKTENKLNIEKFSKDLAVLNIYPDSIFLKFEKEFEKRVPIYPNLNITLKEGYQFAQPPIFFPDSVNLKGTQKDLNNIHFWETQPISLEISGIGNIEIPLKIEENIGVFPNSIIMKYNVQKFIQGVIVVPVQVENLPLNKTIRLYPNTLSIRFIASEKNYSKIKSNHVKAFIDYNELDNRFEWIVPKIKVDTTLIKSFYSTPKGIKYIVRNL